MTTATAPVEITSVTGWRDLDGDGYTSGSGFAEAVAWTLLTHSARDIADLALVLRLPRPEGLEAEDMWSFVFELVESAATIGYLTAKIEPAAGEAPRWEENGKLYLSVEAVARAVGALIGTKLIEDEPATAAEGAAA